MSQTDFLREFDSLAVGTFKAIGIADAAVYRAPGSAVDVPCDVTVDRDVRDFGEDLSPVSAAYTVLRFQRGQVEPERGALVTLTATSEAFNLDRRIRQDESASEWVVANG